MTQSDKIARWTNFLAQEAAKNSVRAITALDKMDAGTYEAKDAFSDWYAMTAGSWLALLPDAPGTAAGDDVIVSMVMAAGATSAVGVRPLAPAAPAGALVAADLTDDAAVPVAAKTIAAARVGATLFNDRSVLLVTLTGVPAAHPVVRGDSLSGDVTVGGNKLATVSVTIFG